MTPDKPDIQSLEDIKVLVEAFYTEVKQNEEIGRFFNDVVLINFQTHIPIIIAFWGSVLLGKGSYKGNPILKHIALHKKEKLSESDFDVWIKIWTQTIKDRFTGTKADEAIFKAQTMKTLMLYKIQKSENGFQIL